jgi:hypothetical protein
MKCLECKKEFEPKTYWQKFCSKKCKWANWDKRNPRMKKMVAVILVSILLCSNLFAHEELEPIYFERLAKAIYLAEGGTKASKPFGVMMKKCTKENIAFCRKACIQTIAHAWNDFDGEGEFLDFLQKRYCPINSDTDNGTCKFWKSNVESLYAENETF